MYIKQPAFDPCLPSCEYIPDGEPRVFGGRRYVYGSHDRFDGADFCLNDYVCWSAPLDDLGNRWRVRILKKAGFNALRMVHDPYSRAMLEACDITACM